jgi:hypothetical protein
MTPNTAIERFATDGAGNFNAKAQRVFSFLATWRLRDFALKGLFYP